MMNDTEKSRAVIIHPVPLEVIMKIIDSGQQTCACEVAEMSNMQAVEENVWPKEVIFLVFPSFGMKFYSEIFESALKFRIQRHQLSIFIKLDFVGVACGFQAGICCMQIISVIRVAEITARCWRTIGTAFTTEWCASLNRFSIQDTCTMQWMLTD